jgi:alpha-ribazole phosphatase
MNLYLIRHGEIRDASHGRLIGHTDVPLSAHGLEQAQALAHRLGSDRLSAIYSSDLQRARTTAEMIAKQNGLTVKENPNWREIGVGQWEGLTMKRVHDENPELVKQLFADPSSFQYPGGESFANFTARIQSALEDLLSQHAGDRIALVTHGGVCRMIIANVLGVPPSNWLRLAQDYGCLNVIEWYDGNPMLRLLNSVT